MAAYATLGVRDFDAAKAFSDNVLAPIGGGTHREYPGWRAYSFASTGEGMVLWICKPFEDREASGGNGTMVGFSTPSRVGTDAFHAAGLMRGGTDEGPPGHRPQYGSNWYAAYLRDPSGHKLAAAFRG